MSVIAKKSNQLRSAILRGLYYGQSLSILELSKVTKKSVPLVTSTVNNLVEEGSISEEGLARSTGGRRALNYLLNPQKKRYIVAVAMDQLVTKMVIYDLSNAIVQPLKTIAIKLADDKDGMSRLVTFIKENIAASGLNQKDFLGIGIGMPGFVNDEKGIYPSIINNNLNISLKDYLIQQFKLPVYIDNDSSLIAFAEFKFGKGMGKKDILVLNVGWGTGLGMIINGVPFRGHSGYGAEFSHIPLSQSNELCSCGKRGCIEVETSLTVMVNKARKALDQGAQSSLEKLFKDSSKQAGDHFLDAASQADPLAISILSEAAFQLGKGIVILLHIINPEKIIISGRGAIAGKMLLAPIQQAINEFCILRIAEQTTIEISDISSDAELLGAAALVIEHCHF